MSVDYNAFAHSFAKSRKNMKWEELEYFFSQLSPQESLFDIGCGSGRLIEQYGIYFGKLPDAYHGVDLSNGLLDEAKKMYPQYIFDEKNMLEIEAEDEENIFLIASFHHLQTLSERQEMMNILFSTLKKGGKIFMTNWALESKMNLEKYKDSLLSGSENQFGSKDFSIPFGEHKRYYHCFTLSELEYLAEKTGFQICENRLFNTQKNFITILQK